MGPGSTGCLRSGAGMQTARARHRLAIETTSVRSAPGHAVQFAAGSAPLAVERADLAERSHRTDNSHTVTEHA